MVLDLVGNDIEKSRSELPLILDGCWDFEGSGRIDVTETSAIFVEKTTSNC